MFEFRYVHKQLTYLLDVTMMSIVAVLSLKGIETIIPLALLLLM